MQLLKLLGCIKVLLLNDRKLASSHRTKDSDTSLKKRECRIDVTVISDSLTLC